MAVKFFIKTLGCKVNQYDSLVLERTLKNTGFVCDESNPDLVIINTCAVTKNAIRKDRKMLNRLKTKHPKAKFVLMGCFIQTYPEETDGFDVDLTWGTGKREKLADKIMSLLEVSTNGLTSAHVSIDPPRSGEQSRYFLKIQDGCEQFCSYCNIPFARGKLSSRPKKEVIKEVKGAIEAGFGEIVLCGIHLGLYGKEQGIKTCNLTQLLKELVKVQGLGRLRLSSIEVNDINEELLDLMSQTEKICEHLHIPLQSGSDKILRAMNRPYDTKYFKQSIDLAREKMPDIAITTDIITGFPGETNEDFEQTLEFSKQCNFSKMHIFPFSQHEKTAAARMSGKISEEIKKGRTIVLKKVGKKMEIDYENKFFDKDIVIIIEKINEKSAKGKEDHYFDVEVPVSGESMVGGSLYKIKYKSSICFL